MLKLLPRSGVDFLFIFYLSWFLRSFSSFLSLALPKLSSWNAFTQQIVAPSPASFCPPLSLFASLRCLSFPYESPSLISPGLFMSGPFVFQSPSLFQVWPGLEWNQDSPDPPREFMDPLTRLCFLLLLGRLPLLAFPLLFVTCFSSLSRQGAALAHLTLSHLTIWWSGLMSLFPFLLRNEALAFLPTAHFVALFLRYSASSAGFGITNKSAISLFFSYLILALSLAHCPILYLSFYLKVFPTSGRNCLLFPLYYQATMDPQTLIFYDQRRGWWVGQTGSATRALYSPLLSFPSHLLYPLFFFLVPEAHCLI